MEAPSTESRQYARDATTWSRYMCFLAYVSLPTILGLKLFTCIKLRAQTTENVEKSAFKYKANKFLSVYTYHLRMYKEMKHIPS